MVVGIVVERMQKYAFTKNALDNGLEFLGRVSGGLDCAIDACRNFEFFDSGNRDKCTLERGCIMRHYIDSDNNPRQSRLTIDGRTCLVYRIESANVYVVVYRYPPMHSGDSELVYCLVYG